MLAQVADILKMSTITMKAKAKDAVYVDAE